MAWMTPEGGLYGSSRSPLYQVNLLDPAQRRKTPLANKCFQRWDAGEWYLLRRRCEGAGHALYPHPKTTGDVTVHGRNKSQILSGGREMDRFSLIRAPNPTKVIEMDEPAVAMDSSGVPSTIERSPLDFAQETEASDRGTAAPKMPPPEDVPTTTARGDGCALERAVKEAMMGQMLMLPQSVPANVSDPDPLAFFDAQSPHPVDVAQSSQGVAAAGDPESENVSSPAEVGSSGSVYRPEWGVTNGSLLDTPEACQDLVDHAAPPGPGGPCCSPGYFFELRHMHNKDFLGQYNINLARQMAMGSQLRLRFEQEAKLLRKSVAQELDFPRPFWQRTCYVNSPLIERPRSRDWGQGLLGMSCDGTVYLIVTAFAYHVLSDGVPVSVPTVVPQGLALLLVDAATQTDLEDA
nr:hypothetical protein [Tanacetum cinerariifolium]